MTKLLGPGDNGATLTFEEYWAANYTEGYHYELVDGKLAVYPFPEVPHVFLNTWLLTKLMLYKVEHSEAVNWVTSRACVHVPGRSRSTVLGPDVCAYRAYPLDRSLKDLRWEDANPILVAEIIWRERTEKDLVRNVELYLQVPTIKEYWVVDGRSDADQLMLRVFRRRGSKWATMEVSFGETYTTKLLPGFELKINPRL